MRIKELITEDKLSWCLNKFSQLVLNKMYGDQWGEFVYKGLIYAFTLNTKSALSRLSLSWPKSL